MIKYKLQRLLEIAKHWGGMAGALSLFVVVMQNVFQRSEMATQDRVNDLKIITIETKAACDLQASSIVANRKELDILKKAVFKRPEEYLD